MEQERNINSWHGFPYDITEDDFAEMIKNAKKGIRKLKILENKGPIVHGVVRSQSGVSEWCFDIDFNDCGNLTGQYWISSENHDSHIPERVAEIISSSIQSVTSSRQYNNTANNKRLRRKSVGNWKDTFSDIFENISMIIMLLIVVSCFAVLLYYDYSETKEHQQNNDIKISASSNDLKKESVENAVKILDSLGFRDIETVNMEDLKIGLFAKEGDIESISIDGDSSFAEGDWFPADAVVVVSYHGFPED